MIAWHMRSWRKLLRHLLLISFGQHVSSSTVVANQGTLGRVSGLPELVV
jgi:hypothetical protein